MLVKVKETYIPTYIKIDALAKPVYTNTHIHIHKGMIYEYIIYLNS
jgi:hypothetical protein